MGKRRGEKASEPEWVGGGAAAEHADLGHASASICGLLVPLLLLLLLCLLLLLLCLPLCLLLLLLLLLATGRRR